MALALSTLPPCRPAPLPHTTVRALKLIGGILVFWEPWQKHPVKCEEMKLNKISDSDVKVNTEESKNLANNDRLVRR